MAKLHLKKDDSVSNGLPEIRVIIDRDTGEDLVVLGKCELRDAPTDLRRAAALLDEALAFEKRGH